MTLRSHLLAARRRLEASGIPAPEAARDASVLAGLALGWDRATVLAHEPDSAPLGFDAAFTALVDRRARREPVAYIRGWQEFWGRDFLVSPAVLIPRPETESIVEEAAALHGGPAPYGGPGLQSRPLRIIDIGTGTGCLAVTLAAEWQGATVIATDISAAALAVARVNADRYGVAGRVEFREGPYLAGATGPFDLIVSNPPYIAEQDYQALMPEVRAFEPATALRAGADGLRDIREVVAIAAASLVRGGHLLMEIGYGQAEAVRALVEATPSLELVSIRADLQGIARTLIARRA